MRSVPCVRSWRSLDRHPFDDGYLVCPLTFHHKRGEYFVEFLFSGGVYLFWLELVKFRLYLGASLCTYIFSSCLVFDGIFMLGGVLYLVGTLFVSCFKLLIDLYL